MCVAAACMCMHVHALRGLLSNALTDFRSESDVHCTHGTTGSVIRVGQFHSFAPCQCRVVYCGHQLITRPRNGPRAGDSETYTLHSISV